MGTLSHEEIIDLHAAVVSAGLVESRSAALAGLDARFVAGLPRGGTPSAQILLDLTAINDAEELHGGTVPLVIWLENIVVLTGQRVEIEVFRPVLDNLRHKARVTGARSAPGRPDRSLILLIDDDRYVMQAYADELKDVGFRILIANSIPKARELLAQQPMPWLVVTDIMMPPADEQDIVTTHGGFRTGLIFAQELRRAHPLLRLVAFTNSTNREALEWFTTKGDGYLYKPEFLPFELAEAILSLRDTGDAPADVELVR